MAQAQHDFGEQVILLGRNITCSPFECAYAMPCKGELVILFFAGLLRLLWLFRLGPFVATARRSQVGRLRIGDGLATPRSLGACRPRCPCLFRLWRCRARTIVRRTIVCWFDRNDMLNQAIGLLVHFCHELSVFPLVLALVFAFFSCNAPVWSRRLAAFDDIGRCRTRLKLFVVSFELLAFACWPRIIARFRRETLGATLPAGIVRVGSSRCAFLPLLAIVPARARLVSLKAALGAIIAVETARLAVITLEIACWPVVAVETALGAIIALEAARRPVIAPPIVAARWGPVIGVARIVALAEIAAF